MKTMFIANTIFFIIIINDTYLGSRNHQNDKYIHKINKKKFVFGINI